MRTQLEMEREIAKAVVRQLSGAPVTIFQFVTTGDVASVAFGPECIVDSDHLLTQINAIQTVPGRTTLRDAVSGASARLKMPGASLCREAGEHILIVLSDGDERSSSIGNDELMKKVRQSGTKIYVIALLEELRPREGFIFKSSLGESKDLLKKLISETGGRIVFPKRREKPQEVVERLFSSNYKAEN
jgi:hypothetical protein